MNWETLRCYGDSITIGTRSYLGYPEYCGYLLKLATNKNWDVQNLAVSGFTTVDLLRYLDQNPLICSSKMAPEVISLMVGTNDAKVGVSIENFRIAYDLLITKIKVAYPAALLLLFKIPFLTEGVKLPYKTDMNEIISSYNDCIEEMAKAYQLAFLLVNFSKSETFDGVHLNSSGVEKAAQILSKKILSYRE